MTVLEALQEINMDLATWRQRLEPKEPSLQLIHFQNENPHWKPRPFDWHSRGVIISTTALFRLQLQIGEKKMFDYEVQAAGIFEIPVPFVIPRGVPALWRDLTAGGTVLNMANTPCLYTVGYIS